MNLRTLESVLDAGLVKRYHTEDMNRQESVAEHSFGVAQIAIHLCGGAITAGLLKACLWHDAPELVTGDLPAPIKWKHPIITTALDAIEEEFMDENNLNIFLTTHEKRILKWADGLHLMWYCLKERKRGNLNAVPMFYKMDQRLEEYEFVNTSQPLRTQLIIEMEKINGSE